MCGCWVTGQAFLKELFSGFALGHPQSQLSSSAWQSSSAWCSQALVSRCCFAAALRNRFFGRTSQYSVEPWHQDLCSPSSEVAEFSFSSSVLAARCVMLLPAFSHDAGSTIFSGPCKTGLQPAYRALDRLRQTLQSRRHKALRHQRRELTIASIAFRAACPSELILSLDVARFV